MISRSLKCFVAGSLAALMMTGGQWFVLQTIAWARMIVVYSQHDSLALALVKTFDGQHPCALCYQIRQGQQEEQQKGKQSPRERSEKMPEPFCDMGAVIVPLTPMGVVQMFIPPEILYSDFIESPPTPPPRAAVGAI